MSRHRNWGQNDHNLKKPLRIQGDNVISRPRSSKRATSRRLNVLSISQLERGKPYHKASCGTFRVWVPVALQSLPRQTWDKMCVSFSCSHRRETSLRILKRPGCPRPSQPETRSLILPPHHPRRALNLRHER